VVGRLCRVKRVAVVGSGGAGKSTLARELGQRTGIPVIHLALGLLYPLAVRG